MACEVTVKDIQNLIRNRVKDKFDSVKFTKYSDRVAGFIPYDASNPSKNVLYGKVKNLESLLNKEFNSAKHGAVVSFRQTVDGVEFNIHPSRKLAEAMSQQNIEDEQNNTFNSRYTNEINYALKAVDILQSDKAKQVFDKAEKNKWSLEKILNELQIPKEQKQLILNLGITDREQIALELVSNYSYAVEINTAKEKPKTEYGTSYYIKDGYFYQKNDEGFFKQLEGRDNPLIEISKEEYEENQGSNTQHYSNLTVPGGTNYTENEIATPAIIPSIKGHAQFATDNGIGWFRSDEKAPISLNSVQVKNNFTTADINEIGIEEAAANKTSINRVEEQSTIQEFNKAKENGILQKETSFTKEYLYKDYVYSSFDSPIDDISYVKYKVINVDNSKTRRILEVQSDLFQKGRGKDVLAKREYSNISINDVIIEHENENYILLPQGYFENKDNDKLVISSKINEDNKDDYQLIRNKENNNLIVDDDLYSKLQKLYDNTELGKFNKEQENKKDNQFLQLLNKDNNWVTFFVKSIIQDSAKKGYEKVLFPTGNTASKVEGHTTLEEFKREKEARIKLLEEKRDRKNETGAIGKIDLQTGARINYDNQSKEDINREIEQLKQELERIEGPEGFAALKPIYNFYENTVKNVLNKQYGKENVKQITDEYGNTWNEITLEEKRDNSEIHFSRYSNRQENESIPNNQQPIGDNYVEFVRYKKAQLEDIKKNINYLKNKLRSKDDSNNRAKLKEYYNLQQEINNQLEILSTNQVDYMFHAIIEDLQAIKYALDSNVYHNVVEVSNKLNWYKDFIPNLDLSEHEDFNGISGLLNSITKTYNDKIKEKALKMLEDEEQTQFLLKVQNEGKLENEKITVEDLVKVSKDIDWLDLTFLGLKSSTTDNTIIPQFLLYKHNQIIKKRQADMLELHDRLDAVIKRNKMTDFDWVFSKDSKGNKDGFLIDLFSEKWYAADSIRKQKLSQYQNSLFDANIDTKTTYTNVINWYKENTIVIDFTRLNVVKEKFGALYPEYFTYNDTAMSAYEENIKKQLGPRYEDTIFKILDKLQKFEELKLNDDSDFKERNIASHNVWEFLKAYKAGFPNQIEYTYGEDNKVGKVYFNPTALNDLQFLPESKITKVITTDIERKEEKVDTGFYSEEFQNILSDNAKVEYWTVLKDMSEFIKNSYQLNSSGRLEYPKINKRLSERAIENLKSLQANRKAFGVVGKTFRSYLHEYKSMFYGDSKDKNYKENKVVSTYVDNSSKEIKDKVRTLMLKSGGKLKYKEALEQARAEILPNYSSDINTLFKAMTAEAAMHEARVEMQPIAQSMIEYFKTIKSPDRTKDGKERKNAINKLETYYKSIILNQNLDNTNTIVGKPNKHLKELKITKLYTDAEKSLMKDLGVILEKGLQDNIKLNSNESILEEKVKNENGTTTISIINNSTGKIRKEILDNKGNLFQMKDTIEGKDYTFQAIINSGEILYNANGEIVDFEIFNQKVKDYIQDKIDSLGQDTTLAGITDGILKTVIWNSLAFSPVSGFFNRMEGKHSAMLMDLTGQYWTPGNIDIANQMMAFSNLKKIKLNKLPIDMQGAKEQVEIFDLLIKKLDVLQDRKNELQKNISKTAWSDIINPFKWAVDNPEFKNQGAIMLSILMDTKINGVPLLNKETGKFEAFYIQDGVLKLKPEFENMIDFGSEEFSTLTSQMVNAISHSQGDYDIHDIKKYKTNLVGRASTLFLTWMPEHINQRWGVVGDNSYDYFTGKKKQNGRYITAAKANPVNFASYWLLTGAITYGTLGLAATAGIGVIGTYLLTSRFKALSKNTNRDIHYIQEFIGLLQHIVAESLNYPSRMLNMKKGRIGNIMFLGGDLLQGNNLTQEQIGAIQSMARELAFMLNALLIKFAIAALMYDDDDDRESQKRQYYNFIQNQLSRSITSLSTFTNPDAFMKDNTRVAFLSQLVNISQLLSYGLNNKEDETSEILGTTSRIFGMPNTINRALFEGTMPWESKTNYDELSFEYTKSIKPLSWFPKYVKDKATDGEYSSEKDYNQIRKDLREELRNEYMDKVNGNADALEKVVNIIIERKIGHKNKGVSYKETLEDLEDGSISNKKKSTTSLKKQKESLKEILKEADLSNSEIGSIMREVYATKKDSN